MGLFDRILGDLFFEFPEGRPMVTLSYAQSLDGCITARRGQPLALSGQASMCLTHQLRSAHQGILAGVGTILADDPQLNVRLVEGPNPQPIILDSTLRTPSRVKLFGADRSPILFATRRAEPIRQKSLEQAGAQVFCVDENASGRVDLHQSLRHLGRLGFEHIMVEGGAQVITSFLKHHLVDNIVLTIAPVFVGGVGAVERLSAPVPDETGTFGSVLQDDFPRLPGFKTARAGDDLIVWGKPQWKN